MLMVMINKGVFFTQATYFIGISQMTRERRKLPAGPKKIESRK